MPNGAVARLPLPQTPSTGAPAHTSELSIEHKIGEAVASAACAIAAAVEGCLQTGVLDPAAKDAGSNRLAKVAELALDYEGGDADFFLKGRNAGRRALRRYFTDVSPDLANAAIDATIDPVFEIVSKVVMDERIFRAAWAN